MDHIDSEVPCEFQTAFFFFFVHLKINLNSTISPTNLVWDLLLTISAQERSDAPNTLLSNLAAIRL